MGAIFGGGGGSPVVDNSDAIKKQEEANRKEEERLAQQKKELDAKAMEDAKKTSAEAKARRKSGYRILLSKAKMGFAEDKNMQQKLGGDQQQV